MREKAATALQAFAMTEDGQAFLAHMVDVFGFARRSTFSTEPLEMALREGQRSVMQYVGALLDLDVTPKQETPDGPNDRHPDDFDPRPGSYEPDDFAGGD